MSYQRHNLTFITALLIVLACSFYVVNRKPSETDRVRATVKAFMEARLNRDDRKVRTFLTVDFHNKYVSQPAATLIGTSDPHYHRYRISDLKQSDNGTWLAFVRLEEHSRGFAPIGWTGEVIQLVEIGEEYRVLDVRKQAFHPYTDTAP